LSKNSLCDKRSPVARPEDFIGREDLIWRIKDKVFSGERNYIAIISDDGMGKSSLINYLCFEETQKNLIGDYEKHLLVLVNNTEPASFEDFFFNLHEAIHDNIQFSSFMSDDIKAKSEEIFSGEKGVLNVKSIYELKHLLNQLLYYLYKKDITTTIIFDDLDKMTKAIGDMDKTEQKRDIAKESFKYLRTKAHDIKTCNIRYIITSRKPIESISKECYDSGFPGIFENETLELFSDKDIDDYLVKCNMDPANEKYGIIRKVSGGCPGLLRSACRVMARLEEKGGDDISEEVFLKMVVSDGVHILESHWNNSSSREKELYKAVANGENVKTGKEWSRELERGIERNILDSDGQFRSMAFCYYVKNIAVLDDENKEDQLRKLNDLLAESNKLKDDAIDAYKKSLGLMYEQNKQLFSNYIAEDARIKKYNSGVLSRESKKEYNEYVKEIFRKYMAANIAETGLISTLEDRISLNVWEEIGTEHQRLAVEAELLFNVYRETDNDQSPVGVLYGKLLESLINKMAFSKIKSIGMIRNSNIMLIKDGESRHLVDWDSIYIGNLKYVMNQCRKVFERDRVYSTRFNRIYTFNFREKLENIRLLRNKCDHERNEPGEKVTPEDIEVMRDALFGAEKDDTGLIEAIVDLYNM